MSDSDFFYKTEQHSANHYINTVPMWRQIKIGNWKLIEKIVREIARMKEVDLDVWTGSIGILTLPDANNQPVKIYLHPVNCNRFQIIPVFFLFQNHQCK